MLREFRGVGEPLDLERNVSRRPAICLGSILRDGLRLNEGIEESRLRGAWREVAGEFVAQQTEPVSLREGTLILRVLQPSMKFHLEQTRSQLLRRLQNQLGRGTIRQVKLVIG